MEESKKDSRGKEWKKYFSSRHVAPCTSCKARAKGILLHEAEENRIVAMQTSMILVGLPEHEEFSTGQGLRIISA
jgi:hypothetical protein